MSLRLAATAAALSALVLAPLGAASAAPAPTTDRAAAAVDAAGTFTHVPGTRILDTRTGLGAPAAKVGEQRHISLRVAGRGGIPATGVAAVVLNVTGVDATNPTWVTAWPTHTLRPDASQLNTGPGDNRAGLVTVPLGPDGSIYLYNGSGTTHLLADVVGYYADGAGTVGGGYHAVAAPHRSYDSRGTVAPWAAGDSRMVPVGAPGMDAGVSAVSINLTAQSETSGWLTAWDGDGPVPGTSTVNYRRHWATPNHAIVPVTVDAQGRPWIEVYASSARTGVIVDVVGWYDAEIDGEGLRFTPTTPTRVADRDVVGPGGTTIAYTGAVAPDAVAVVANVLGTSPSYHSWLGVSPTNAKPVASTLNLLPGEHRSNSTVATTRDDGAGFYVYNAGGTVQVTVDVLGYFR